MGLTKEQKDGYRQSRVLEYISEPGGATGGKMAKLFKVPRGTIVRDIAELRKKGYPIQVSSMITEDGMYQAVFELMRMPAFPK